MKAWLRVAVAVCIRTWLKTARRPVTLVFSFLQPVIWMLFFGFLFHRYQLDLAYPGVSYVEFLVPGICTMTVLFGASQSGVGLLRDIQTGFLYRMLESPAPRSAIIGGKLVTDVTRLLLQAAAILVIGMILGAKLTVTAGGIAACLFALASIGMFFCGVSSFIAMKTRAQEGMATFVHLVNMPLIFTSSVLVPMKQMPGWLARVAEFNPLTLAVDICRQAVLFGNSAPHPASVAILLALGIFGFALAVSAAARHAD
jgi:ABC-2 type transport system permease protein